MKETYSEKLPYDKNTLNIILEDISQQKNVMYNAQYEYLDKMMRQDQSNFMVSLVVSATLNRGISLIAAYINLAENNNYLAATSLIRLQIDNALSLYAMSIVDDMNDFARHIISGKEINSYKIGQNKLTNGFLTRTMEQRFCGICSLYKEMCNFIHLSNRFLIPIAKVDNNRMINVSVGEYDFISLNDKIIVSLKMLNISKALSSILNIIIDKAANEISAQ